MKQYTPDNIRKNRRTHYSLYKGWHPLFEQWVSQRHHKITPNYACEYILSNLPAGNSIWIDSFGHYLKGHKDDIVSVEYTGAELLLSRPPDMFFVDDPLRHNLAIDATSTVIFESRLLKYLTPDKFIDRMLTIKRLYSDQLIVVKSDLMFMDFNRLKYTYKDIHASMLSNIPNSTLSAMGLTNIVIIF